MITIRNAGQDIVVTDYWTTEPANVGICYLSANAGALRLLVPEAAEGMIPEMKTGRSVLVEPSIQDPRCIVVVFEDGSDTPFSIAIDMKQIDRKLQRGSGILFSVWTQRGKVASFTATVRI